MWVLCKSDGVKKKKLDLFLKKTEIFRRTDAVALTFLNYENAYFTFLTYHPHNICPSKL